MQTECRYIRLHLCVSKRDPGLDSIDCSAKLTGRVSSTESKSTLAVGKPSPFGTPVKRPYAASLLFLYDKILVFPWIMHC
jgi:hypothetical protein